MKYTLSSLIVSLLLVGCAGSKIDMSGDDYIKMEKGGGLGEYKMYTITIRGDRFAEYVGKQHVDKLGHYTKRIRKAELKELWRLINTADLHSLKEKYGYDALDTQAKFLTVVRNGSKKVIMYKAGVPLSVKRIEQEIERLSELDGWVKVK